MATNSTILTPQSALADHCSVPIPHSALAAASQSALRTPHSAINTARKGKVARLPKPARDLINRMMGDGLPYHVIIEELGQAGEGLTPQNLSNWRQGGYQDWLKQQAIVQKCRSQVELAVDLLKELGDDPSQIYAACRLVAALDLFQTLNEHGRQALKEMLQTSPQSILPLIRTICTLSDSSHIEEKHRLVQSLSNQIKVNQTCETFSALGATSGNLDVSNQIQPNQGCETFSPPSATQGNPEASNQIQPNQGCETFLPSRNLAVPEQQG